LRCYPVPLTDLVSSLSQRGWVFQERLLSRRVLHLGGSQLLWECNELTASETHPNGLPKMIRGGRSELLRRIEELKVPVSTPEQSLQREQKKMKLWSDIIGKYSQKKLTNKWDKLPAITGVVKHLRTAFRDECVAGLWRKELHRYLAWHSTEFRDSTLEARGIPYRAPTWPWVSTDNVVSIYDAGENGPTPLLRIHGIEPRESGACLGSVNSAEPELAGSPDFNLCLNAQGPLNKLDVWHPGAPFSGILYAHGGEDSIGWSAVWDEPIARFTRADTHRAMLYTVPLYRYPVRGWPVYNIRYLLLFPVEDAPGYYYRVGIAKCQEVEGWTSERFLTVSNGHDAPCEEFLGEDEGHRFKII